MLAHQRAVLRAPVRFRLGIGAASDPRALLRGGGLGGARGRTGGRTGLGHGQLPRGAGRHRVRGLHGPHLRGPFRGFSVNASIAAFTGRCCDVQRAGVQHAPQTRLWC